VAVAAAVLNQQEMAQMAMLEQTLLVVATTVVANLVLQMVDKVLAAQAVVLLIILIVLAHLQAVVLVVQGQTITLRPTQVFNHLNLVLVYMVLALAVTEYKILRGTVLMQQVVLVMVVRLLPQALMATVALQDTVY
jgi:hypothetical protein